MIEDLGGCFHHFSHLLACPQGDGKEILSFSSLVEILIEGEEIFWKFFSLSKPFLPVKIQFKSTKLNKCISSNCKIYLAKSYKYI